MKRVSKIASVLLVLLLAFLCVTGCEETEDVKDIKNEIEKAIEEGDYSIAVENNVTNGDPGLAYAYLKDYDAYAVCDLGEHPGVVVNIPEKVNGKPVIGIAKRAFADDITLYAVAIPDTVKVILSGAFEACAFLEQVTIGSEDSDLLYIQNIIFANTCVSSVTYKGTKQEWKDMLKDLPGDYFTTWAYNPTNPTMSIVCNDGTLVYWSNSGKLMEENENKNDNEDVEGKIIYTVTKEEWDANMDATNYTMSLVDGGEIMATVMQTKDALAVYASSGEFAYCAIKDGVSYSMFSANKEQDKWIGYLDAWIPMPWYKLLGGGNAGEEVRKLFNFDHFTFDKASNAYKADMSSQSENLEAVLKFENGKLVFLELSDQEDYIKLSNIGTTTVTVPDFIIREHELEYTLNEDGVSYSVTGCGSNGLGIFGGAVVVIPRTYKGLPVTKISRYAFEHGQIASITIPDSVTSIEQGAFSYCDHLNGGIYVDENNPAYSSDSFGVLFDKAKKVLIYAPANLVGSYSVPNGVISIDDYAFSNCDRLTSITIPYSVTSIGRSIVYYCEGLKGIYVDKNNPVYSNDSFGVLFDKAKNVLIQAPAKLAGSYSIPNSVTTIGDYAFYCCESLTSVTIPNSVTIIDNSAFSYCTSLQSITIPSSVTTIGNSAFYRCESLTNITIPNSVTTIGNSAFYRCESLTNITIPNSVTTIGYDALYYCNSLTSITYKGTIKQWQAIDISDYFDDETDNYTIYCTDGKISKDGTVTYY